MWLREGDYSQLDAEMNQIQREYEEGKWDDIGLRHTSRAFYDTDPTLEANYNSWVENYPQSYAAHQARAAFYGKMATRTLDDGKDISQMSEQEKADMQHYASLAFEDNKAAMALTPKPFLACVQMIEIGWFGRSPDLARQMLDKADEIDPHNFIARVNYMPSLETRWGGSFKQMKEFREEVGKAGLPKDQLVSFDDLIDYEKGWTAKNDNSAHSAMLREGKYGELDKEMNQIQQDYEMGIWTDEDLSLRFQPFNDRDPELEANFYSWLASYPKSYAAHQARAIYSLGLAWKARGTGYISKTPSQQIAKMEQYLGQAMEDDKTAIGLTKKPLLAYANILEISMLHGSKELSRKALDEADKIDPGNFVARENYMDLLQPKWGGSFEEMKKYREEARMTGVSVNILRNLDGMIFLALADFCDNCDGTVHDYTEAAKWYRKAADIGVDEAQFKLGQLYAAGHGVTQSFGEAYFWLNLSALHGNEEYAATRDQIAEKITPQQLEDAKRRAREWIPIYNP